MIRKDVKLGMMIGIALVFCGWIFLATVSETPQQRRQKQLESESPATIALPSVDQPPVQSDLTLPQDTDTRPTTTDILSLEIKIHTVQTGQTLSAISKIYYNTPDNWQKILDANKDQIQSPTQIKAGMKLKIPPL